MVTSHARPSLRRNRPLLWLAAAPPAALAALVLACHTVDHTGRRQLLLLDLESEVRLGGQAFEEISAQHTEARDPQARAMIDRVGRRIAAVVDRDFEWEFRLFESDDVNAFALPGGKVAFYTGILPICANEDGVAAVMGHEIAHVVARHGNERVSQGMGLGLVLELLELGLGRTRPETRNQIMALAGAGAAVGLVLPWSRNQELEADELGLRFMIRAGYDPHEAVSLWERMEKLSAGRAPPEFFSTHPDPGRRAERLRELIPKVLAEEGRAASAPPGPR